MTGVVVLACAVAVAIAGGLVLRARNGRVRRSAQSRMPEAVLAELGRSSEVTLVLFTTEFCAQCRQTRVVLADLAERTAGLRHTEIDLTNQLELAKELSVLRTPTTIAVDSGGVELLRVGGLPKRDTLLDALRPHLP